MYRFTTFGYRTFRATYTSTLRTPRTGTSPVSHTSTVNVGKLATNGCIAVSRCNTIPAVVPVPRFLRSPASRRAIDVTDCPSTKRSSPQVVSNAHSRCSAAVNDDEITATRNSAVVACSTPVVWSADATSDGRTRCRKIGRSGGARGVRGIVSTKVASRRGASMSAIVAACRRYAQRAPRNFVGGHMSRQRSMSSAGARPDRAALSALETCWRV